MKVSGVLNFFVLLGYSMQTRLVEMHCAVRSHAGKIKQQMGNLSHFVRQVHLTLAMGLLMG